MLRCVCNINVITSREKYLCLIEIINIAHGWPGTSVPVRPVWHTGAQTGPSTIHIYQISFNLQDIRLKLCILIAVGLPNNIYNFQLDSISENKMVVVSYLPILAVWCWNLGLVLHSVYPYLFKLQNPYFEYSKTFSM